MSYIIACMKCKHELEKHKKRQNSQRHGHDQRQERMVDDDVNDLTKRMGRQSLQKDEDLRAAQKASVHTFEEECHVSWSRQNRGEPRRDEDDELQNGYYGQPSFQNMRQTPIPSSAPSNEHEFYNVGNGDVYYRPVINNYIICNNASKRHTRSSRRHRSQRDTEDNEQHEPTRSRSLSPRTREPSLRKKILSKFRKQTTEAERSPQSVPDSDDRASKRSSSSRALRTGSSTNRNRGRQQTRATSSRTSRSNSQASFFTTEEDFDEFDEPSDRSRTPSVRCAGAWPSSAYTASETDTRSEDFSRLSRLATVCEQMESNGDASTADFETAREVRDSPEFSTFSNSAPTRNPLERSRNRPSLYRPAVRRIPSSIDAQEGSRSRINASTGRRVNNRPIRTDLPLVPGREHNLRTFSNPTVRDLGRSSGNRQPDRMPHLPTYPWGASDRNSRRWRYDDDVDDDY